MHSLHNLEVADFPDSEVEMVEVAFRTVVDNLIAATEQVLAVAVAAAAAADYHKSLAAAGHAVEEHIGVAGEGIHHHHLHHTEENHQLRLRAVPRSAQLS